LINIVDIKNLSLTHLTIVALFYVIIQMFIVMQNYFHCAPFMLTVSNVFTLRIMFGGIFDTEIYIYI